MVLSGTERFIREEKAKQEAKLAAFRRAVNRLLDEKPGTVGDVIKIKLPERYR